MYEYGNEPSDTSNQSGSEYRYSGPFYQDSDYQTQSGYSSQSSEADGKPPKKKKKFGRLIAKTVCVALVFGVVASAAFQGTNYLGKKAFGDAVALPSEKEAMVVPEIEKVVPQYGETQSLAGAADVSAIVEECMPSLVAITNVSVREVESFWGFGWYNMPQQQEETSTGTGIIIGQNDTELLMVTNNHVIANAKDLSVVFSVDEGKEEASAVAARIKGTDPTKDVGVIAVALEDIPAETLAQIKVATIGDSSQLKVGQPVIAIGNSLGYGQSVTQGIISALNRSVSLRSDDGTIINNTVIQTDAAINPGNSGGALLDMNGQVIGINEAKLSSNAVEGVGYAIPISDVEGIIGDLKSMTTRSQVDAEKLGYLGITCQDVTPEISEQYGMPVGVYLKSVLKGCAADQAGLHKGDILTKFDGVGVTSYEMLKERLQYYEAGEKVSVTVMSPSEEDYVEKTVELTLNTRAEIEAASK